MPRIAVQIASHATTDAASSALGCATVKMTAATIRMKATNMVAVSDIDSEYTVSFDARATY